MGEIDKETLQMILDQCTGELVQSLKGDINLVKIELSAHVAQQNERDIKIADAVNGCIISKEYSELVMRKIIDIPEMVRGAVSDCVDPKLETVKGEIKSVNDKIEQHIKDHLTYRDFKFKTWQILLGIPAIVIMLGTAAYNAYVALRGLIK